MTYVACFTRPLLAGALVVLPFSVAAQDRPDAGRAIQDLDPGTLQLPEPQRLELNLPDAPADAPTPGGPTLEVKEFTFEGNQAISDAALQEALMELTGRTLSLGELQEAAHRVTRLYRERGYPLARAYVPAQEIDGGVVRIAVLEGRLGEVEVSNTAGLRGAALNPLNALKSGEAVRSSDLERSLLLLQATPGIEVRSTLRPGSQTGETDLLVALSEGRRLTGRVEADNHGNRYTGQYRLSGSLYGNNLLGLGDQLSLRAMATNEEQYYGRLAWQLPVGPWNTQLGASYSHLAYELGKDFSDLDAYGTARIASVYAIQPLMRSRTFNLDARLQYDHKRLQDNIKALDQRYGKRSEVTTLGVAGDSRDGLGGGGITRFALSWSVGQLRIEDPQQRLIDDLTAQSRGSFQKVEASVLRLQRLTDRWSLLGQAQAQWAHDNLDSSEKMSLGGANGVRAYPQGEATGDQGWLTRLELRYAVAQNWQASTFVDHGEVRINRRPWTDEGNRRSLSGAGLGLGWADGGWQAQASVAWRVGGEKAASAPDRNPRLWVQVGRDF